VSSSNANKPAASGSFGSNAVTTLANRIASPRSSPVPGGAPSSAPVL
jgi:hypothetical protein